MSNDIEGYFSENIATHELDPVHIVNFQTKKHSTGKIGKFGSHDFTITSLLSPSSNAVNA